MYSTRKHLQSKFSLVTLLSPSRQAPGDGDIDSIVSGSSDSTNRLSFTDADLVDFDPAELDGEAFSSHIKLIPPGGTGTFVVHIQNSLSYLLGSDIDAVYTSSA